MVYINSLLTHNGKIGKLGEDLACGFLVSKGHEIIERNFKNKIGEIDIVTKLKNKIHIVEVKTSQSQNIRAEENMNAKKMRKVAKLGEIYARNNLFCVDFVGVYLNSDLSLKNINYLENIEIF